jgi:hypothetical protein
MTIDEPPEAPLLRIKIYTVDGATGEIGAVRMEAMYRGDAGIEPFAAMAFPPCRCPRCRPAG